MYAGTERVIGTSALFGTGLGELKRALSESARPGNWLYDAHLKVDQSDLKRVEELIRAELFSRLSHQLPYVTQMRNVVWRTDFDGGLHIVEDILVSSKSMAKIFVGTKGCLINDITQAASSQIEKVLNRPVALQLQVKVQDKMPSQNTSTMLLPP